MSRPGSSLSRSNSRGPGSRPNSPARKIGPNQTGIPAPNTSRGSRRALPLTPQKRKPDGGHMAWEVDLDHSRRGQGEITTEVDQQDEFLSQPEGANVFSQPESELGRATNLLIMDPKDIEQEATDTVTTLPSSGGSRNQNRQKAIRLDSGKMSSEDTHSGGEELSQGSTTSKHELKSRYVAEITHRKRHEDTINQLSIEYSNLLKKYAEAENTIDELRLGAKVKLYGDSPIPGQASSGVSMASAQKPGVSGQNATVIGSGAQSATGSQTVAHSGGGGGSQGSSSAHGSSGGRMMHSQGVGMSDGTGT